MTYGCSSGNFSSRSVGGYLQYPGSSCGSSYPGNLVYSSNLWSPTNYQLGSSLSSRYQETCCEPISCHRPCVVSRPCQTSCYCPRVSTLYSPCQTTYSGSLGFGSSSCRSLGYGSRSCYSLGCGSSGSRPQGYGIHGFPSLGYGSGSCCPSFLTSRTFQASCYRPTCGSGSWFF
ncbi:Keratin-associated protein 13-1 [Heterocephalus glaber]|uniref:Keratin-associated protein n=1 Tax=Heterocephalus glaber TaxID=10181 RepID=G5AZU7_HETGA|nr:keratin-associated protein 13-1 isoform X2 [Heterocephalus glaber]EHB02558.1 Keratin-associated protein 13-1 [Heterocephalus glaber]